MSAPLAPAQITAAEFNQAVTAAKAQLAREIDKNPGVNLLANILDQNLVGAAPLTAFGAVVALLHKAASILIEVGAAQISHRLSPLQRRAIAEAAVHGLIFGALTTPDLPEIEAGATVAGTETQQ